MSELDGFEFLKEILVILKMGEMGHFWAQNQHFLIFLQICSLGFSDIVPDYKLNIG